MVIKTRLEKLEKGRPLAKPYDKMVQGMGKPELDEAIIMIRAKLERLGICGDLPEALERVQLTE